jgi:hypothetical protein
MSGPKPSLRFFAATRRRTGIVVLLAVILAPALHLRAAPPPDPLELVRRAMAADEPRSSDPALGYKFLEHSSVRDLDKEGRVKSEKLRTRSVQMADYVKRRERFRKPMREIPDAFTFSLVGEESVDSRPCYVLDASPRSGYKPVDRYSRLLTRVRGKVWLDQQTGRWVKLEAELLDTVTFGWILLRIHQGARARLTQRLVDGEVWLPAELWYRASYRIGLISLRHQESETLYDGYTRGEPLSPPPTP